jgi:3alpha(or 20beta)-hydroxysteroid dehydrogenase
MASGRGPGPAPDRGLDGRDGVGQTGGRLEGRTALVTGSARGTGEATARLLAAEGARVVVSDVLDERGEAVAAQIGEAALYQRLDVTSEADWARAVECAVDRFGSLDILVNNAAILLMKALPDTELAEFQRVVAVNQVGTFLGMKAAFEPMKRAGGGSIVNVSSIDGLRTQNGLVAYCASKWAVRGMTRVAALELGRYGIRVNAVCPEAGGPEMVAEFLPEGVDLEEVFAQQMPALAPQRQRSIADRVGDVARMILFLASDESASCTGADFVVDGANTAGVLRPFMPRA